MGRSQPAYGVHGVPREMQAPCFSYGVVDASVPSRPVCCVSRSAKSNTCRASCSRSVSSRMTTTNNVEFPPKYCHQVDTHSQVKNGLGRALSITSRFQSFSSRRKSFSVFTQSAVTRSGIDGALFGASISIPQKCPEEAEHKTPRRVEGKRRERTAKSSACAAWTIVLQMLRPRKG